MTRSETLFGKRDLRAVLEEQERSMLSEIDSYPADDILNTSVDDLVEYYVSKFDVEPIVLLEDELFTEDSETTQDARYSPDRIVMDPSPPLPVPAVELRLVIPFTGEKNLFRCRAARFSLNPPRGRVSGDRLVLSQVRTDHDARAARREFDNQLGRVREGLAWIRDDLERWRQALPKVARDRINGRRDRLLKDRGLVAELGFPIKERKEGSTYVAPGVRKKPPVRPRPEKTAGPFKPEPTLDDRDYTHILRVISATATALERSPGTFGGMDEEELRDQFLVPLNSHYEGQATGETFNASGKTDVIIRVEGRSIFIAECKIWRGPKSFTDAIDQLLSYTTWRDSKTALMVFNKNKDFSAVLSQLRPLVEQHPSFKRFVAYDHETGFRAVLGHPDDSAREITVTVLGFDVPEQKKNDG